MRGAGFGYIVGRFFEKPCRFSALNVAVRGWREKTRKDLRQAEEQRRKRDAKTFSEKCRFGGSKVAVVVWEEILREIGSVLAPDARERRGLAPFWHQKAKTEAGFSRVASILMPPSKGKSGCGIKIDAIKENFQGHP